MNFESLPKVLYNEVDTAAVEKRAVGIYENEMNTTLFPGDPVRILLNVFINFSAQHNAISNYTNKMNLLRYAKGPFLDALAEFLQVYRLEEFPAKTMLKFSMDAPRAVPTVIPIGVRATADGRIFFATDKLLVIAAGETQGEIAATCLSYGIVGNGLIEGQINRIVDRVAFITAVENTKQTEGGSDIESDEDLLARVMLAPHSFSTAGPELAYIFWALSAHGNVGGASVISPLPGYVNIFVMLKGGHIPELGGPELEAVKNALNEKERRPLTDFVTVYPINHEPIDYTVTWFITSEQAVFFNEVSERIDAAIKEYEEWQTAKTGRDIVPDKLVQLCRAAGAKRIVLNGLYFTILDPSSIANFIDNPNRIIFGGVESE